MPNTGWNYPASANQGTIDAPYPTSGQWLNPTYIKANDSNYTWASVYSPGAPISNDIHPYNFTLGVPTSAQIDGVYCRIVGYAEYSGLLFDYEFKLTKSGAYVGDSRKKSSSTYWTATTSGSPETRYYGSSTDLWGLSGTLTYSYVNSTDFGFGYQHQSNYSVSYAVYLNYGQINVYYTTAPADPTNCAAVQNNYDVDITWTDNATDENYYEVQVDINGGGYNTLSSTIPANSEAYTDTTGTYNDFDILTYRVRALKTGGPASGWSTASPIEFFTFGGITPIVFYS